MGSEQPRHSILVPTVCWTMVALMILAGCSDSATQTVTTRLSDTSLPSVDVRGGQVVQGSQLPGEDATEGVSGAGGELRIISSTGDVRIQSGAGAITPPTPLIAGQGLDIVAGATLSVNGRQIVDHLRVRAGATLRVTADTIFVVTGDVDISGSIVGIASATIDAPDLTISAGGIISVSGSINLSGRSNFLNSGRTDVGGGVGGSLYLSARGELRTGPHLFVSGIVDVSGGSTDDVFTEELQARPGKAGRILLGSLGTLAVTGKLIARGGSTSFAEQVTHGDGAFADGGFIEIVALSDIDITNATDVEASGGDCEATNGGKGGTITLEAPIGTLDIDGTDLSATGGDILLSGNSEAGEGGNITLFGDSVDLDATLVSTDGGQLGAIENNVGFTRVQGEGGNAGTVEVGAFSALVVSDTVVLRSTGGDTELSSFPGGNGGNVKIVNLDSVDLSVVSFEGTVEVFPGIDTIGSISNPGTICQQGSSAAAIFQITNNNEFPIESCAVGDEGQLDGTSFIIHDLDCDNTTLLPPSASSTLPSVTGVDFYRVQVGTASSITITTTGEFDLDLFVGAEAALGSLDSTDYAFASRTANSSDESVTVDLTAFTPGQFLTVLLVEQTAIVEDYTLAITCTE